MSAGVYKMTCYQASTFNQSLTWRNPSGTPIDVTGYAAELRVARNKGGVLVLNPSTDNGQVTVYGVEGRFQINIAPEDTADIEATQYIYEFRITNPSSGEVTRLLEGPFVIDGQV